MVSTADEWAELSSVSPLHARVSTFIRRRIERGEYPTHRPLPPSRLLATQLGVSRNTVQVALQTLMDEQLVYSRPRSGIFPVATNHTKESIPQRGVDWDELLYRIAPPVPQIVDPEHTEYPFPFLSGQVEARSFPTQSWLKAVGKAMSGPHLANSLGDPREGDDPQLISALIDEILLPRGVQATSDEVMITVGVQQGLFLVARALAGPGVRVAIENPGYVDAHRVFQATGAEIQLMNVDARGAQPGSAHGAHVAYVTPSSQHPTSVVLSPYRRHHFLEQAENDNMVIIEDDYDAEMRLEGPPLAPMKSLDQTGRVIYLGTFSKYLSPGLRIGFVVGHPELIDQLRRFRYFATKTPSPMMQRALALFIRSGDYARQLRSYRVRAQSKFEQFAQCLTRELPEFSNVLPGPRMNVWLPIPVEEHSLGGLHKPTGRQWAERARQRGALITPGSWYYAPEGAVPDTEIRVGLASIPTARIGAGVRVLAEAYRADQDSSSR